jgi:hypothetical protein
MLPGWRREPASRHREERSDAAIQHPGEGLWSCFAAFAMAGGGHVNDG